MTGRGKVATRAEIRGNWGYMLEGLSLWDWFGTYTFSDLITLQGLGTGSSVT
jgi:hypothetical protein